MDYIVSRCPLPFVEIGGIKEHNIGEVARHGARLICAVTEILEADVIGEKIIRLREKIKNATAEKPAPPDPEL